MPKRYRVTQTKHALPSVAPLFNRRPGEEIGDRVSKDYRWLWMARLSAWYNRGESASGLMELRTIIEEVNTDVQG